MNSKLFLYFISLALLLIGACSNHDGKDTIILEFNGKSIPLGELDVLGQIALAKQGLRMDTEEGQAYYREIAPNLYETLITTYTMKYLSELEGFLPTPEELEAEFAAFKGELEKKELFSQFIARFQITEEQLKETMTYEMGIKKLQDEKFKLFETQEPTQLEIHEFYYQNRALFRYPKRIRASHILVAVPLDADQVTQQQASVRAENLRKMIGEQPAQTFPGLAQQYSDDTITSPRGGDLGFFDRDGQWPESFKQAAFALKEGQVSEIVETNLGYHLIWATDHEQSEEEAFDEVKTILINKQLADQFVKWIAEERSKMEIVKLFDPVKFEPIPRPIPTP